MRGIVLFILALLPGTAPAKTLVIGDSLAYTLTKSAQKITLTDGYYLVGSGLVAGGLDWLKFMETMDIVMYDKVIISIGANDGITSRQLDSYKTKVFGLISIIKNKNSNIPIVWILPPAMKNVDTENRLIHTREAINQVSMVTGINTFNPSSIIGDKFISSINGVKIRTQDGIHYTQKGGDLIINWIWSSDDHAARPPG